MSKFYPEVQKHQPSAKILILGWIKEGEKIADVDSEEIDSWVYGFSGYHLRIGDDAKYWPDLENKMCEICMNLRYESNQTNKYKRRSLKQVLSDLFKK